MKYRIRKDITRQFTPWRVTGWVPDVDHDDWLSVDLWVTTFDQALALAASLQRTAADMDRVVLVEQPLTDAWCEWFLNCPNHAVDTRQHLILGDVPVCESCARRIDEIRWVPA